MITHHNIIMWRAALAVLFLSLTSFAFGADADKFAKLRADADSLHAVGRTDSAIIVATQAMDIARRSGNPSWRLGTHSSLGVYLRSTGKVDEALANYDKAMSIATTKDFRDHADEDALEEVAALYINIATLHLDMVHKDEAARYAATAAGWTGKCADKEFKGQAYGAIGSVFTTSGHPDRAVKYQEKSYDYAVETGNSDAALRAAAYSMLSCDRLDRTAEADKWRGRCAALLPEVPSVMARLVYFQAECSINLKRNRPRKAIAWFDSILNLDGISNLPFVAYDCYNNMHKAYSDLGEYRLAYETLLKGNAVRDTLYEQQKAESLRELNVKYDAKEKELALARSEADRANMRFWLAVALIVLMAVGIVFAMYAMRQRRRRHEREMEYAALRRDTERQLTTRYVEGLESERTRMARELHDGVCNDLMAIQMRLAEEQPESPLLPLIDTCREQVRRISHELLPPEFSYATIDEVLRYYTYKLGKAAQGCDFTYESAPEGTDWTVVPDATALEIYRIVQEAAGNAVKHSGATRVTVAMSRTDRGIELTVTDNGTARTQQGSGIGRRTMRQRAAAVGGSISVDSGTGGTVVRLTLDLQ